MEVYALLIRVAEARGDIKSLERYHKAVSQIQAAIPDSGTLGVIYAAFGKMHMAKCDWAAADVEFFDAMKYYADAGNTSKAVECLKYKVLASMVSGSSIDQFASQEAKQFEQHPEALAMVALRRAYAARDMPSFQRVLHAPEAKLQADAFIQQYIQPLLAQFRVHVALELMGVYGVLAMPALAKQLDCSLQEAQQVVHKLMLDGQVLGSIDGVRGLIYITKVVPQGDAAGMAGASAAAARSPSGDAAVAGGYVTKDGQSGADMYTGLQSVSSSLGKLHKQLCKFAAACEA